MAMYCESRTIVLTGSAAKKFNDRAKHPSEEVAEKRDRFLSSVRADSCVGTLANSNHITPLRSDSHTKKAECENCKKSPYPTRDRRVKNS